MAREYVVLTPADGALFRLARAVARQTVRQPLTFAALAQRMCEREAGKVEVNVAQMSEILAGLRVLLAEDPGAVIGVLADKA